MKQAPLATVIGDLVSSRVSLDRADLHRRFEAALAEVNAVMRPVVPLWITAGDEYQGCFATVGEALAGSLRVRLALLPEADVRHGVGWGSVTVLGEHPRIEDGPGWWAARAAIEWSESEASKAALRHVRTAYRRAEEPEAAAGPDPLPVNAALVCRDQMVGSALSDSSGRSLRLLRGLLDGRSQVALAEEEGVSASAVSQRVRRDGLAAIVVAEELLEGVR